MRVLLLTLLLVVCVSVNGGFFGKLGDKVKKTFGGEGSVGQKLKNITKTKFEKVKKIFGSVSVAKIREKLSTWKDKVKKMLELTPRMLTVLKEKLAARNFAVYSRREPMHGRRTLVLTSKRTAKIRVFFEKGCWSYVGRRGGKQDLSLGKGCDAVATATHELGHALGFYHTMARHDRDEYIIINVQNIQPGLYDQFTKQTTNTNENYNITYDYGSIMNYGGRAGSYNGEAVIVPNDVMYQETLGGPFLAFYDILMMNTHYNCLGELASKGCLD
ncbi:astacin [Ancylostoma caninum]|uniref:Metalloendopeptidase n=1 Tax=Ancylostoma caninum TaxID=29170 RepID=A0A368FWJ1_ANCCA|nr:astacin [Ancylostoma caninum]